MNAKKKRAKKVAKSVTKTAPSSATVSENTRAVLIKHAEGEVEVARIAVGNAGAGCSVANVDPNGTTAFRMGKRTRAPRAQVGTGKVWDQPLFKFLLYRAGVELPEMSAREVAKLATETREHMERIRSQIEATDPAQWVWVKVTAIPQFCRVAIAKAAQRGHIARRVDSWARRNAYRYLLADIEEWTGREGAVAKLCDDGRADWRDRLRARTECTSHPVALPRRLEELAQSIDALHDAMKRLDRLRSKAKH